MFKKMAQCSNWNIKAVLLDITGVLYESGQTAAIAGSVHAIERLRNFNMPLRFVTNETQNTRSSLAAKLKSFGFTLSEAEIFTPAIAASAFIRQKNLTPYLLVHPGVLPDFDGCNQQSSPDCVVVGDAGDHFTFERMNSAFQILVQSSDPKLISLGKGKYYKEKDKLVMDLGGFTCALEYATGAEAAIIGKPSPDFFLGALKDIGVDPSEAVMVGDDIGGDVGGAQRCGSRGVLVRTGKFREVDLSNQDVKPDAVVNNLENFVDMIFPGGN